MRLLRWAALALALVAAAARSEAPRPRWTPKPGRDPIIFIPGYYGSQLEARYTLDPAAIAQHGCACNTTADCSSGGKYNVLWLSGKEGYKPIAPFCWLSKMSRRLVNGRYADFPGVKVRASDFGGFKGIDWTKQPGGPPSGLDAIFFRLGYRKGVDLFGAPYDWRNGEEGLAQAGHYARLRALVERASAANRNRRVVLLSHSMGNHVALSFLHRQSRAWRDKYVRRWVMAAPDFGGDLDSLAGWLAGWGLLDWYTNRELALGSSTAGLSWLSAYSAAFGKEPILITDAANYTAEEMPAVLRKMGRPEAARIFAANHNLVPKYLKPLAGLDTFSFYGSTEPTLKAIYTPYLSKDLVMVQPIMGPGDNDVTLQSLQLSAVVVANRSRVFQLPGVGHSGAIGEGEEESEGVRLGRKALLALLTGNDAPLAQYSLAAADRRS